MIRPFKLGDLLLVQRLGHQAAKLNIIQALLQPRPALMIALGAVLPWAGGKANTYILRQQKNSLAHAGFIQSHHRPGRAEADITFIAPALDTPWGHPAIWEKLLSHYVQEAATQNIYRVYADVPDQPLPVQSFTQAGFKIYTRQTIWRLNQHSAGLTNLSPLEDSLSSTIRPIRPEDEWPLIRLYHKITPKDVQLAEGIHQNSLDGNRIGDPTTGRQLWGSGQKQAQKNGADKHVKPLILDWWQSGHSQTYVLVSKGEVQGSILIGQSPSGYWLRLLVDTTQTETEHIQALLRYALVTIDAASANQPIYIGVRSYHGGLPPLLSDYGFAPFTDLARMVRHVPLWIRTPVFSSKTVLDPVRSPVPTTYIN